jgi:hypothetical protein
VRLLERTQEEGGHAGHDQNVINAARTCRDLTKEELVSPSQPWFSLLNHNKSNAFGKCVSWNARHKENSSSS